MTLRIGTRGSPMALFQANLVRDRLVAAHPGLAAEIAPIRTTGDRVQDRPLAEIGGKGLFSKEIEAALIDRRIDIAVHSLKDMETILPEGLEIGCVLPRDDPRDALCPAQASPPCRKARGSAPARCAAAPSFCGCAPISRSHRSAAMSTPAWPSSPPASSTR